MSDIQENSHNLPEVTVSEIAQALKEVVEGAFGRVRVRGEISNFLRAGSGHLYFSLKDADSVLDGVCWRSTAAKQKLALEDGMDVIVTGRMTTYGGRSKYQIVVERVELAGEGALLKMLEDRRKKLNAEGLFDPDRKQPVPYLPDVIGVVTSPTGAVIRDILHRLSDRFPRRVLLWPVLVQGEDAPAQIANAIRGFNALTPDGDIPRPDVLIVARGGGSLEDLMAFNEEVVVRAAADSDIPLISAVGHETDTTLIDYAADLRAPTPTAAAEMAVPVLADLLAETADLSARLARAMARRMRDAHTQLDGMSRRLPNLRRQLEESNQRLDDWGERLTLSLRTGVERKRARLNTTSARLVLPHQRLAFAKDRLGDRAGRLHRAALRGLQTRRGQVAQWDRLLESYSYHSVLKRGFALVRDNNGQPVLAAAGVQVGASLDVVFHDGALGAQVTRPSDVTPKPAKERKRKNKDDGKQGTLL